MRTARAACDPDAFPVTASAAFGGSVADGAGAFGLPNPADVTSAPCGTFTTSVQLAPGGLPPGMTIYNQGVVISTTSTPPPPNGQFHITTEVTITT